MKNFFGRSYEEQFELGHSPDRMCSNCLRYVPGEELDKAKRSIEGFSALQLFH